MKYILPAIACTFAILSLNSTAQSWNITGNGNATNTSVLGTKNTFPLRMMVNNIERVLIDADGRMAIGTGTPEAAAILDVSSTSKGVLFPRMTRSLRNVIATPPEGLLIYQTDNTPGFYYYKAGWKRLSDGSYANQTLSNLKIPTAVNVDLLPGVDASVNLGSGTSQWKDISIAGSLTFGNSFTINANSDNSNFFATNSGFNNTSGTFNTATGFGSLYYNQTGYGNVALGYQALYYTNNSYNSGLGYYALFANTNGYANHAAGAFALYYNTTGSYNVACGPDALINNTTGNSNTAVGLDALRSVFTTSYNTGIGSYAGASEVTYSTYLGANTSSGASLTNVTSVGYNAYATASNQVMLGNTAVTSVKAAGTYVIYSDGRFKKDIKEEVPGLAFINQLRPVTYHYDIHGLNSFITPVESREQKGVANKINSEDKNAKMEDAITAKEKILYSGFVAQEVEATAKKLNYNFSGVYKPANDKDVYGLSYSDFVVPLVKAVQELSAKLIVLEKKAAQVDELETRIAKLELLLSTSKISDQKTNVATSVSLGQNIPNPFSSYTTIPYDVPQNFQSATININDITGKMVLVIPIQTGGKGTAMIDGSKLNSGTYNYFITVNGKPFGSKKMIVIKN